MVDVDGDALGATRPNNGRNWRKEGAKESYEVEE